MGMVKDYREWEWVRAKMSGVECDGRSTLSGTTKSWRVWVVRLGG